MADRSSDDPLKGYGRALRDFHAGRRDATLTVHSDLGEHDEMPVGLFSRQPDAFFPFELAALDLCRGTVLDFGAGTGVHSLALQELGFSVTALEVLPEAVEIMRDRGVRQVVRQDGLTYEGPPVDTLLMLMNGIGPVGTLSSLDDFLLRIGRLLRPGGQILVDSAEVARREESPGSPQISWPSRTADYLGEAWVRLEYLGDMGAPFRELYVDSDTLSQRAGDAGFTTDLVFEGEGGGYLARLARPTDD
jgi:SAM-dependent methyltransferase